MAIQPQSYLFTVEDYHKMGTSGIIPEDARTELIEGEIIQMTPKGTRHAACVNCLMDHLFPLQANKEAIVKVQDPILLDRMSEPEPDLVVAKYREDYYDIHHPQPDDIFFIVEVGDSSIEYDRRKKLQLYSRNGIPEVWLVDLTINRIEVHVEPSHDVYKTIRIYQPGDSFSTGPFPDITIDVSKILRI